MLTKLRSRAIASARSALGFLYARRLQNYPELRTLLASYSDSESAAVDKADAIALYEAVIRRKPRHVLELGPGTSTAIIASALQNGAAFLAVEESKKWLDYHQERLPTHLASRVEMITLNVATTAKFGAPSAHYVGLPQSPYDFIHVDGPGHLLVGCKTSCDVMQLMDSLAPACMIIFDGRQDSARLAQRELEVRGFKMRWNPYSLNREFVRG